MYMVHTMHTVLLCPSEGYMKIQMSDLTQVKLYFQVALLSFLPNS